MNPQLFNNKGSILIYGSLIGRFNTNLTNIQNTSIYNDNEERIIRIPAARADSKYSSTLSPGDEDLPKENNYKAPAPANRLRMGTSSGVDYIFRVHPLLSLTPTVISRPFILLAEACKLLPDDPTSIHILNCLDEGTGGNGCLWLYGAL